MVLTHLQSVHMDPVHWKDPGTFNPDRFLENGKLVTKEAFYPYSIGNRHAIMSVDFYLCNNNNNIKEDEDNNDDDDDDVDDNSTETTTVVFVLF